MLSVLQRTKTPEIESQIVLRNCFKDVSGEVTRKSLVMKSKISHAHLSRYLFHL